MKQLLLLIIVLFNFFSVCAQPNKKPLDHTVYNQWKTIKNVKISNDGNWVTYEINPLKGDGYLYIVNPAKKIKDSIPRGYDARFSAASDFLVFKIKQPSDTIRKLKLEKKKDEDLPKDSAAVWNLKNMTLKKFDNVKSYKIPKESGAWIGFLLEEKKETQSKKDTGAKSDTLQVKTDKKKDKKKKEKKQIGTDFLFYHPFSDIQYNFKYVTDYVFSENGKLLVLASVKKDSIDTASVIVFMPQDSQFDTVFHESGNLKNINSDKQGTQLTFMFSADTSKLKQYSLWHWKMGMKKPEMILDTSDKRFFKGWTLSENATPYFSDDGAVLYLGTCPKQKPEPKDTLLDEEKVKLDLWSWTDGRLQSHQLKDLEKDKKKSYLALLFLKENHFIQIADTFFDKTKVLKTTTEKVLLTTNQPYEKLLSWESPAYNDIIITETKTGKRIPVLLKQQYDYQISPNGKYLLFYKPQDSSWNTFSVKDSAFYCLTCNVPVKFFDEEHDAPQEPYPYGVAGWTENDTYVLIYDRFDIWKFDPCMKEKPVNITKNGRQNQWKYRYVKTNPEEEYIGSKKQLLLTVFSYKTKQSGFCSINLKKNQNPEVLFIADAEVNFVAKANNADKLLFTVQTFRQYPDVIYTNTKFSKPEKISNANPQQREYLWGTVEPVSWKSFSGIELEGLLYKPENFNPKEKYPVIVYFYEKYSDQIHSYWTPSPSRSIINPAFYCSNGYIVFMPDIHYKIGYPGQSAYDCVVSGTEYLKTFDYVDAEKIGIQGQSWGGYQVAYIITQTDIYKAAMAGAAVSNMISAYGGIRWESGMSRMFQYEDTQSRIGATLWEKPELYISNSPIFFADKVKTPLLMMNNDNDGAVPWYQGIEFFTALRRLNKPVWMLNYNSDAHNLERWPNRVDLSVRMKQFFDHYLKGEPMPEWMLNGIPAVEKGTKLGYELVK